MTINHDGVCDITLEKYEYSMAVFVGARRQAGNRMQGRVARNDMPEEDGWEHHIEGACGELAVAKLLNCYWSGSQEIFGDIPDLLPNVDVKTRSKHSYDLLIRRNEELSKIFVLVTGLSPFFKVRGWCVGTDVVDDKWLATHGGRPAAYFIPQSELSTDWRELKRRIDSDLPVGV